MAEELEYTPDEQKPEQSLTNVGKTYTDPKTGKFVKGNPGGGRPPGSISLITIMKQKLEMLGPDEKRTVAEHLIENVIQDALEGKDTQLKLLFQYVEGMPKQAIDLNAEIKSKVVSIDD